MIFVLYLNRLNQKHTRQTQYKSNGAQEDTRGGQVHEIKGLKLDWLFLCLAGGQRCFLVLLLPVCHTLKGSTDHLQVASCVHSF